MAARTVIEVARLADSIPDSGRTSSTVLEWLAAPHWSILCFLLLAGCALLVALADVAPTRWMALPFLLLVINLAASIATHARFRHNIPLLVFHLSLLVFVALLAWGRMTYLSAKISLTSGEALQLTLAEVEQGPLHESKLDRIQMTNQGFSEHFPNDGRYPATVNRVRWLDAKGRWQGASIGDDNPLVVGDYRIYTGQRRGYAPRFRWHIDGQAPIFGSVQIDLTDPGAFADGVSWQLPGGERIWAMLDAELPTKPLGGQRANLGVGDLPHSLILRIDQRREALLPGESVALKAGQLTYLGLDSWLAYRVIYDTTRQWLLGCVLVAILSLSVFYWQRVWRD